MKKLLLILVVIASAPATAQKIRIVEGDLSELKGQTSIITELTYDNMIVGDELTEEQYIAKRRDEMGKRDKTRAEKWEKAWKQDRQDRFEPKFNTLFAKHSGMKTVDGNAKYKLIFNTKRTEPGFNIGMGIIRNNAYIDADVLIMDGNRVVAKLEVLNAPGRAATQYADFDTGTRLQEAYAKAGKELGAFLKAKSKSKK